MARFRSVADEPRVHEFLGIGLVHPGDVVDVDDALLLNEDGDPYNLVGLAPVDPDTPLVSHTTVDDALHDVTTAGGQTDAVDQASTPSRRKGKE